jgi:23S rRNA pseudouridine1911/1915/1917 synthase
MNDISLEETSSLPGDDEETGTVNLEVQEDTFQPRLDQFIVARFPNHSRSFFQTLILEGKVTLNGAAILKPGTRLNVGDRIEFTWPPPQRHDPIPEAMPLSVVYEDASIMVIDKPAGLVVHPGSCNWEGTLLNALLHYAPQLEGVPRAGIVHRLDKDTSGLLVVAKTLIAQTALVRQLQARSVKREYLALVWGELRHGGKVDAPIGRHPTQRVKMAALENGKPAVTHYQIEEKFPGCTLLRCRLETGRTHQIRVHMTSIGHPLVGDSVYLKGAQKCVPQLRGLLHGFPRQALHATRLALEHPHSGETMEWHAPLPQDLLQLLQQIREIVSSLPIPSPQSSDRTTSHSTRPSQNDVQVAGYPASGESEARGAQPGEREKQFSNPAGDGQGLGRP